MAYTIQNNIPNTTYKVESGVLTVTANSGYIFDGTPTVDNLDQASPMDAVELQLNVSSDKKTASVDLGANDVSIEYPLVVKGTTVADAAYIINNTVANTSYVVNGDTLTVTANDGYKFETAPTAESGDSPLDMQSATGVLSANNTVATFNLLSDDSGQPFPKNTAITVSGSVVEKGYLITNNIVNTSYEVIGDTLTVRANDGYKFETAPTAESGEGLLDSQTATGVLSENNTVATFNLLSDDNGQPFSKDKQITVSGSVVEKSYIISNTIANTTYSVNGDTLTVTANSGYKFETAPTIESGASPLDMQSATGVLSENNTVATFNLLSDDSGQPFSKDNEITVNGSVVEKSYIINNTIANTTYSVSGDTLTVTANSGYKFETAPMIESGDSPLNMQSATGVLSDGGKVATFNLLLDDSGNPFSKDSEITVRGSVVEVGYTINNTIEHTTYSLSGDTLTVTADNGYKFEVAPTADNTDSAASPLEVREETGVLSDNGKVATFNLLSDNSGEPFQKEYTITLKGSVVADVVYSGFYGSINVYELTNDNLKAFAEQRFSKTSEDLGKYVTNLFRIFCPVGDTIDAVITTGDVNTGIQAKTPKSDIVVLDFGDVTIPFHNNDVTDYNSNIQMFLPFVGFVNIDVSYIGKAINLTYEVNVITGEAVVKLSNEGVIFSVYNCNVSSALIYKTSDYDIVGDTGFSSRFMYGLKPFVKVVWRQSMNEYVNNDDCVRTTIGHITGFARITECEVNTSQMTSDEKQMIENQLKYGVFIEA